MIYISQIEIEENFVENIIENFKRNIFNTYTWDETRVLSIDMLKENESFYNDILNLSSKIKLMVSNDKRFSILQNVEIVKYPCGAHKNFHKDTTRNTTTGASITYLNDNYIGGHTVIEGVDVQPLSGRTVYFDGREFRHGVSNVIKRDRYTLSMWYGRDDSMPINNKKEFMEI